MSIITLQYNDQFTVDFTNDAWFNATEVAKQFGKRPVDWLSLDSTKQYLADLCEILKCEESSLLKTQRGKTGGGSWFSPRLSVPFARWLDSKFSIWCDFQIEGILHSKRNGLVEITSPYISEKEARLLQKAIISVAAGSQSKSLYTKLYDGYSITTYHHVPAGKLNEALVFLGLQPPEMPQYVLIDVREWESLKSLPAPVEQKIEVIPNDSVIISRKDYDAFKKLDDIIGGIRFALKY